MNLITNFVHSLDTLRAYISPRRSFEPCVRFTRAFVMIDAMLRHYAVLNGKITTEYTAPGLELNFTAGTFFPGCIRRPFYRSEDEIFTTFVHF